MELDSEGKMKNYCILHPFCLEKQIVNSNISIIWHHLKLEQQRLKIFGLNKFTYIFLWGPICSKNWEDVIEILLRFQVGLLSLSEIFDLR